MGKRISKNVACRGVKDRRAEGMPCPWSTTIMGTLEVLMIEDEKGGGSAWEDAGHRRRIYTPGAPSRGSMLPPHRRVERPDRFVEVGVHILLRHPP